MASAIPGGNTTRRTWTNGNGFNITFETTSYSTPGFSFGTFNAGTSSQNRDLFPPPRSTQPRAGGVLGAAFNILGNVLSSQARNAPRESVRRGSTQPYIDDDEDDDLAFSGDEDGFIEEEETPRPKGFKFAEPTGRSSQQSQKQPRSRNQSPVRRASEKPRTNARSNSYRTEERRPSWTKGYRAYAEADPKEDDVEDEYDDLYAKTRTQRPNRSSSSHDSAHIRALEDIAEDHRREIKNCKKRLEQVSRQRNVKSTVLQTIVNELNVHEEAYEDALKNLEAAKGNRRGSNSSRRNTSHQSRPKVQQRRATMPAEEFLAGNDFERIFSGTSHRRPSMPPEEFFAGTGFERFFNNTSRRSRTTAPGSNDFFVSFGGSPFGGFERVFHDDFFSSGPFVHPSRPRSNFPGANTGGPRFTYPTPQPTFSQPTPKPPSNLLKPEEAKALFKQYNERWNALTPTDPNIPYPCRGMQAGALSARDAIWAPLVSTHISTWSAETVMQANAQAFFLGVVGLVPEYTEAPGKSKIVMGFQKAKASQEQVRALVDVLKKEKIRWHSDRLGRRNGGVEGAEPNESLQRDERARAVFHAACALMETAQ